MLLSITHIDILFKIPTNKLITRNYNTFCNLYLYKTNMIEPFNLVKATNINQQYDAQNGELLSDEKLVSFIYFFNHKIHSIYQFKKIENNKLVLVKEIRKSYYDSIIDQKRSFQKLKKTPNAKLFNKIGITLNLITKPEKANRTQMDAIGFLSYSIFLPQLQNIQQEYPASSIVSHNCHQIVQRGY